jgi:hypothetical protein
MTPVAGAVVVDACAAGLATVRAPAAPGPNMPEQAHGRREALLDLLARPVPART